WPYRFYRIAHADIHPLERLFHAVDTRAQIIVVRRVRKAFVGYRVQPQKNRDRRFAVIVIPSAVLFHDSRHVVVRYFKSFGGWVVVPRIVFLPPKIIVEIRFTGGYVGMTKMLQIR